MKKTDNYLYNYRESGDNRKDILHEREDDDMQRIIIERLSVLEKDVLNSIKNDVQDERADMTISAVARRNFVSQALLVKLAKKMGFSGYRDLLFYLRQAQTEKEAKKNPQGSVAGSSRSLIRNYSSVLHEQFNDFFQESRGTVISVFGIENSELVAEFIVRRIMERENGFMAYKGCMMEKKDHKDKKGLMIVVSETGETETSVEMIKTAGRSGCHTIVFTANERSRAAAEADLPVIIEEKSWEFSDSNMFVPYAITAFILLFETRGETIKNEEV